MGELSQELIIQRRDGAGRWRSAWMKRARLEESIEVDASSIV
jgi:hypothetical protein